MIGPRTLDELKQKIQDEIRGIPTYMLQHAVKNPKDWKNAVIEENVIQKIKFSENINLNFCLLNGKI